MKINVLICAIALLIPVFSTGQNARLVIYSEEGDAFTLTLNGKPYTEDPVTRVEIDEVEQRQMSAVVQFKDKSKGMIKKNVFVEPKSESVYRIKMNRRGRYKLRLYSTRKLNPSDFTEEPGAVSKPDDRYRDDIGDVPADEETADEEATKEERSRDQRDSGGGGGRQETKVRVTMPDGSTMGVSVETSERMEAHDRQFHREEDEEDVDTGETEKEAEPEEEEELPVYVAGYTGRIGCPHPISESEADNIVESVQKQSFSESRMKTAKRALRNSCIRVSDVSKIVNEFSFESSKVEFAKFAYDRTHDVDNYYKLYDLFNFSSSVDEVDSYIENR